MELYLEFLFTAVLSVLFAVLLGKIFTVDADAAVYREPEAAGAAGEGRTEDLTSSRAADAGGRPDPAEKCEGDGRFEVRSGESPAEEATDELVIERSGGVEVLDVKAEADEEECSVREALESAVLVGDDEFRLERVGCPSIEQVESLEDDSLIETMTEPQFEMKEDESVSVLPSLDQTASPGEADQLEFEVPVEVISVNVMLGLDESVSPNEAKQLQFEAPMTDSSVNVMPSVDESVCRGEAAQFQEVARPNEVGSPVEGMEKEVSAAKSEDVVHVNVEKVDVLPAEGEEYGGISTGLRGEEEIIAREGSEEEKKEIDEKGQSLLGEDDDWEGIEETELQKSFHEAAAYVGGKGGELSLSRLSDDEQMQLYGLHKVATEGPCYDPQPMALKLSARAKWHAWQRLGSMTPDTAMEKYLGILSEKVPGWMGEKTEGEGEKHEEREVTGAPELSSSTQGKLSSEPERTEELSTHLNEAAGSVEDKLSGKGHPTSEKSPFNLGLLSILMKVI